MAFYIKDRQEVKMAGDCGLNALSLLPENELPQWRQFSGLRDGLLKPNVSNPFSPYFFFKEKMGVREKEAENYLM